MQNFLFDREYMKRLYFHSTNICGPEGTGKSAFLSEMMGTFEKEHPVIFLDFSDCKVRSFEEALLYIRKKMSELYRAMYAKAEGGFWGFDDLDAYIKIIEGRGNQSELEYSLQNLVYCLRRSVKGDRDSKRPMIFIDEVSRPLLFAAGYGFGKEMSSFFDKFFEIDHYELTGGIFTTSYAPLNTDVLYKIKYISDKPINAIGPLADFCTRKGFQLVTDLRRGYCWPYNRYFDTCISLEECFAGLPSGTEDNVHSDSYEIVLDGKLLAFIDRKKKWIEEQRLAAQKRERERLEQERKEYAAPLPEGCTIPSRFAGIRTLKIEIANKEKYKELNQILRQLYSLHGNQITSGTVYSFIQNMKQDKKTVSGIDEALVRLKERAEKEGQSHSCTIDSDSTRWGRFDLQRFEKEPGYSDISLVKVYLSVFNRERIVSVFEDVVGYLIKYSCHRFHAKVAFDFRNDQMCLWLAREDFFLLERYIKKYDEILFTPLPFIAYRNKMGISREFWTWDSHSGVQATLISSYLRQVDSVDQADVYDMYSKYVLAWNGALDGNMMASEFKKSNAQEFLILLESLDMILGNSSVGDDSILLNGDGQLWSALGHSKNWFEVGAEMTCCSKRVRKR